MTWSAARHPADSVYRFHHSLAQASLHFNNGKKHNDPALGGERHVVRNSGRDGGSTDSSCASDTETEFNRKNSNCLYRKKAFIRNAPLHSLSASRYAWKRIMRQEIVDPLERHADRKCNCPRTIRTRHLLSLNLRLNNSPPPESE